LRAILIKKILAIPSLKDKKKHNRVYERLLERESSSPKIKKKEEGMEGDMRFYLFKVFF